MVHSAGLELNIDLIDRGWASRLFVEKKLYPFFVVVYVQYYQILDLFRAKFWISLQNTYKNLVITFDYLDAC